MTGFDVVRSGSANDFSTATCLEAGLMGNQATDATTPAAGNAFFYLVRAENDCGEAVAGYDWTGVPRAVVTCN
ncbi:MAG: hypothetical protein HC882_06055 [Acidobacteria bacterium]|nr:hypothetical protein [Acidobacteriota bacterium]